MKCKSTALSICCNWACALYLPPQPSCIAPTGSADLVAILASPCFQNLRELVLWSQTWISEETYRLTTEMTQQLSTLQALEHLVSPFFAYFPPSRLPKQTTVLVEVSLVEALLRKWCILRLLQCSIAKCTCMFSMLGCSFVRRDWFTLYKLIYFLCIWLIRQYSTSICFTSLTCVAIFIIYLSRIWPNRMRLCRVSHGGHWGS